VLNDGEEGIHGIVGLRVGFGPLLPICDRVEEFRVCCQSNNEETFKEFSEGVIEMNTSVGCWVCLVPGLIVSFVDGL